LSTVKPTRADILATIRQCLYNSIDVKPEEVFEESFLVRDLGATSIDVLDLIFNIGTAFNMIIDISDIQAPLLGGLSEEEFFNEDRTVTALGYQRIAELVPGFDPKQRETPLTDTGLFEFIQVYHLVDLVEQEIGSEKRPTP
jgi:acyl carrier protein